MKFKFDAESLNKFGDSGNSYPHGETILLIGKLPENGATSLSPFYDVGWTIPGQLISTSGATVRDRIDVELGAPKIHVVSQTTAIRESIAVSMGAFRLPTGAILANGSNLAPTPTYGTAEGVIAASPVPTKKQVTVDDITGFLDQDMIEVDLRVSNYGGFLENTFLSADPIAGTGTEGVLNFDDVPYAPASGTTIKQVDQIELPAGGGGTYKCQVLLLTMFQNSGLLYIRHYPRVDITEGTGIDPKNQTEHAGFGFTFKSKPTYQTKTDVNGKSKKEAITRIDYFISANA